MRFVILKIFLFFLFIVSLKAQIYLDPNATVEERVADLISRMTLEEKVGQMTQAGRSFLNSENDIRDYFLGSLLSGGGSSPNPNTAESWANMYDSYQNQALSTRLKIPLIYGIDAVHGHNNVKDAVIFPHNIGLGATRNPDLIRKAAEVTAVEVAATGIDWTFAPCIAVPRDEKWGRTYEGFGETPELAELAAVAAIYGYQGDSLNEQKTIAACAKHFIGDGGTTGGIDQGNTEISEEELRAIHLPGYLKAIEAGVGTVMASYSSWNGKKLHGHYYLLTTVLKEELGFDGFVVSDWAGIDQLPGDYKNDIKESINAGVDMVMVPDRYVEFITFLKELVNENQVSSERIDDAVKRILKIKFELGLFENPLTDRSLLNLVGSHEHRNIARECVRESIVILQKKDNVLPLRKENQKIALIGKGADDIGLQCGGWTIYWQGGLGDITEGTTLLEAVKKNTDHSNVIFSENGEDLSDSDIAVIVIAEEPYAEFEGYKEDLTIPDSDVELVKKAKEAGLKTVVILYSGRPMIINPILQYSDAVVAAWLPGTETDGITDILFGDFQPKGLLPHSWPKYMDQIPLNIGDAEYDPLYEYGFGLSSVGNSQFGSSPLFYSANVDKEKNRVVVTFNKQIDFNSLANSSFTLLGENNFISNSTSVDGSLDSNSILITFDESVENDIKLSLEYVSGSIKSIDGGLLIPFENKVVYNSSSKADIHTIPGKIEAEDYFAMSGIQTETTSDIGGGTNVGWIDNDDWLTYKINVQTHGTYQLNYRIASQSQAGIIEFSEGSNVLSTTLLPVTGDWQSWRTVSTIVDLQKGETEYTLKAVTGGFNINWFSFDLLVNVDENNDNNISFKLEQNFPNPFNPVTNIEYTVPSSEYVRLKVYDVLGNEIAELVNEHKPQGNYHVEFNAERFPSGTYFYKLTAGSYIEIKKMMLIK
jgi:beta-glucosidase